MRDTPPCARMSAGTRSKAMTATAPASSAIFACSGVTTSMITPPLSISAMPRLTRAVPVMGAAGPVPLAGVAASFAELVCSDTAVLLDQIEAVGLILRAGQVGSVERGRSHCTACQVSCPLQIRHQPTGVSTSADELIADADPGCRRGWARRYRRSAAVGADG
jgi:hypothetical protein